MVGPIAVRALRTLDDMRPVAALQAAIWGYSQADAHAYPARGLFAFVESGGFVGGAFDGRGALVGFSAAWLGREPGGRLYLHSQIVGVLESFRDCGVGRRLKLQQRDFALAQGLSLVKWTFDPLRPRNAHFNLHRLGAVARRFVPDYYGAMSGTLNAGRPSDRLWAEWYVGTTHVARRLAATSPSPAPCGTPINRLEQRDGRWVMPEFTGGLAAPVLLLELPVDLDALAAPEILQRRLRRVFDDYLPRYVITDCARAGDRIVYVLQEHTAPELSELS